MSSKIISTEEKYKKDLYERDYHLADLNYFSTQSQTWLGTFTLKHFHFVPSNMIFKLSQLDITVSAQAYIKIQITLPSANAQSGMYTTRVIWATPSQTVQLTYPDLILTGGCLINVYYALKSGDTTVPSIYIGGGVAMKSLGDEFSKVEVFSDSIGWHLAGNSEVSGLSGFNAVNFEYWPTIVTKFLEDKYSLVLGEPLTRSHGGSQSQMMYNVLRTLKPIGAPLSIVSLGMNDCVVTNGNPANIPSAYTSYIDKIIKLIRKKTPSGTIIITAPSQTDDTNRSTIQTYRDSLKSFLISNYDVSIQNINGSINGWSITNKIIFVDFSTAYPSTGATQPTLGAVYSDSNPKIHPSPTGHYLLSNTITDVLNVLPWNPFY